MKQASKASLDQKNPENSKKKKKRTILNKIRLIETNLDKLIRLTILRMYIKKIMCLLAFICFLFHVNIFYSF